MNLLQRHSCVAVTGSSGSGKSSNVHNTALILQDKGYDIYFVETPSQVSEKYQNRTNKVFVFDDPFGKGTLYQEKVLEWEEHLDSLRNMFQIEGRDDINIDKNTLSKTILLLSCRLKVYRTHSVSKIANELMILECDLSSEDMCLTLSEKEEIFANYIQNVTFESVKSLCDMDYFPLVCSLAVNKEPGEVKSIFKNPPEHIMKEIQNMKHDKTLRLQFCCLCICVMFDQGFNLKWLRLWEEDNPEFTQESSKHILSIICKEFKYHIHTIECRSELLESFCTLNGSYSKEIGDIVLLRHDKIFDIAAKICGETLFSTYISHASDQFISKRYTLIDSPQAFANEYLIQIKTTHESQYFIRIIQDISKKRIHSFAFNDQLENESYQKKLMQYVEMHKKKYIFKSALEKRPHQIEQSLANVKDGFKLYAEFLFKLGVNKDNVLVCVCKVGNTSALEYLLTYGVNVNTQRKCINKINIFNRKIETPLIEAARNGDVQNVSLLLELNADVSLCDHNGDSPLVVSAINGHAECLSILLKRNACVSQCNKDGLSPLAVAACKGHTECVKLLLQNNASVSHCDKHGQTPLFFAARRGRTECVKLLIQKNNSIVLQCDKKGQSPLYVCSENGHTECVQVLLTNNASVSQCNNSGQSPLFACAMNGHTETLGLLLQYNASVSQSNKYGISPLLVCARKGHTECLEFLLKSNANVSQCCDNGFTPLHEAIREGHTECVKLLLEHNADVMKTNKGFVTPLDLAKIHRKAMVHILEQHISYTPPKHNPIYSLLYVLLFVGFAILILVMFLVFLQFLSNKKCWCIFGKCLCTH